MRKNYFLFLLTLVPLLVIPWVPQPYLTPKILLVLLVLDVGVLFSWRSLRALPWRHPLVLAMCAYLALSGIAALFGLFPEEALGWGSLLRGNGWWITLHTMGAGLLACAVASDASDWKRFFSVSSWVATAVGFSAIIGSIFYTLPIIGYRGSSIGTFGNASFLAGYLLIHLFLIMWLAAGGRNVGSRAATMIRIGQLIVLAAALFLTDSRAALLGVIVGGAGMIAAVGWNVWRLTGAGTARWPRWASILGLVLVFVYVIAQFLPARIPVPRAVRIDVSAVTSQTRLIDWRIAAHAVRLRPFLGWGQTGFGTAFGQLYDPRIAGISRSDIFTDDPHNAFLSVAVGSGVLGLAAYGSIFVIAWWLLAMRIRRAKNLHASIPSAVGLGLVSAYAVYVFFSIEHPIVSLFFWLFVGWLSWDTARERYPLEASEDTKKTWPRAVLACLAMISLVLTGYTAWRVATFGRSSYGLAHNRWFLWRDTAVSLPQTCEVGLTCEWWEEQAKFWLNASISSRIPHDILTTVGDGLVAHASACTYGERHFFRTYLLGQIYTHMGDLRGSTRAYQMALATLARAKELAPHHQQVVYAQAELYLSVRAYAKAVEILEAWIREYPDMGETYWYLGLVYSIAGDAAASKEMIDMAAQKGYTRPF